MGLMLCRLIIYAVDSVSSEPVDQPDEKLLEPTDEESNNPRTDLTLTELFGEILHDIKSIFRRHDGPESIGQLDEHSDEQKLLGLTPLERLGGLCSICCCSCCCNLVKEPEPEPEVNKNPVISKQPNIFNPFPTPPPFPGFGVASTPIFNSHFIRVIPLVGCGLGSIITFVGPLGMVEHK
jgi:hypothetical protein